LFTAMMTRVIETLRSPELKAAINGLAGYDGMQSGTVMTIAEAFPDFAAAQRVAQKKR
jgi:hypothetical protein